jgi:hypothetical protein
VQILVVTQGEWGERILVHLLQTAPSDWDISSWAGPAALPVVLDEPKAFLPRTLPQTDLLLVLTESAGMTDLTPDIAELCGAQAVILPVDKRTWARPGLARQVRRRLAQMGIGFAMPMPFCTLAPRQDQHELIHRFARRYGRPELECAVHNGTVGFCEIIRETPCGNTRYIVEHLEGVAVEKAAEQAGLLHHYYPCWGGMAVDPVQGTHTCLHIAATIAQKSVARALEGTELKKA